AGSDLTTRGGYVAGLCAVRRGQEPKDVCVSVSRRVSAMLVVAVEEPDGEWGALLAELLAWTAGDREHKRRILDSAAFQFRLRFEDYRPSPGCQGASP